MRRFLEQHRAAIAGVAVALLVVMIGFDPLGLTTGGTETLRIRVARRIAYPLEHPWGLAFLPNGDMLVTERAGRLRIVRKGVSEPELIPGVPKVVERAQAG